jgi:glycosyltransferase involved in cell wall biosynthesis
MLTCSLVIPCYNEAKNIPALLERCAVLLQHQGIEVVIVDNGSTDDTASVLHASVGNYPGCRVVHVEKNQGYGYGILQGLKTSKADVVGWTHADLQTDPTDVLKALDIFKKHGASVFVKGKRYGRPLGDVFFTAGMGVFESVLLKQPLWDINAQPTLFSRALMESWKQPPYDFSLDLYAYYHAVKNHVPVHRFAVHFGKRLYGVSHWNTHWKSRYKFIKRTVQFSWNLRKRLVLCS